MSAQALSAVAPPAADSIIPGCEPTLEGIAEYLTQTRRELAELRSQINVIAGGAGEALAMLQSGGIMGLLSGKR